MRERGNKKDQEVCINCAQLSGSSIGAEKEYTAQHTENFDVFFGIEHRMRRGGGTAVQRVSKEKRKIAAREAKDTESKGEADNKHMSSGVFMAFDVALSSVVNTEKGAVGTIPDNDGRVVQAWINVKEGLQVFAVYFGRSEGRSQRNEAMIVRTPRRRSHVQINHASWE